MFETNSRNNCLPPSSDGHGCSNSKEVGHVTVGTPVVSIMFIILGTCHWISAYDSVNGVKPKLIYFQKIDDIYATIWQIDVSFVPL